MNKENLVEKAMLQMKQIEDLVAENAKGILASTMKEEISQLVKESLSEQEDDDQTDVEMDDMEDIQMGIGDDSTETDNEDEMDKTQVYVANDILKTSLILLFKKLTNHTPCSLIKLLSIIYFSCLVRGQL